MPAIATSKFRVHNAEQFLEAFSEASNSIMYLFVGGTNAFTDDSNPPTPTNSTANIEFLPWRDSIGAKRIQTSDVVHVVDRYDWTSGTVYDQYDDQDTDILDDDFYVVTDDYQVYKCLFNNGGAASTVKPTGTDTTPFTTGDGYIWKYMYTISTSDALKFLTNDYMPVRTNSTVAAAAQANPSALNVVLVEQGGSGYVSAPTVTITGDGTGATANSTITGDAVTAVTITASGNNYTYATVSFSGGSGSGAVARAIIPPKGGHGNNAIEELGGKFVMINVRLDGSEANTISTANDFRKIALVRDPFEYGTETRAQATNYRQTWRISVTPNTNFSLDETVTVGSNTASVVEWDSVNNYLYVNAQLPQDFANGETIVGGTTGATGTIVAIQTPGLDSYSGDVLYVENRSPISRAADQIEDVKLVIEF
jgi:hypothetical protein